ncbi:MAG: YibE/F family protein [Candidatus Pacebacteria bacterium]|nr:YibE/F family protein [Candidatus Paceibacterota bacterium]
MKKYFALVLVLGAFIAPSCSYAQEVIPDTTQYVKARVVEILDERYDKLPTSDAEFLVQTLKVEILRGDDKGSFIQLVNDIEPLRDGSRFLLRITHDSLSGTTYYSMGDFERRPVLIILFLLFIGAVIWLGGRQGMRSLLALSLSFAAIFFVLIPLMLRGHSPVLVGSIVSVLILLFAIVVTHGFRRTSYIAFAGTSIAVIATGLLAWIITELAHITGFASHEAVYLNFNTGGNLDFAGLYLAGVIIGMLGVLDDISITQVAVVRELQHALPNASTQDLFVRALRVGKEHVSALVNTLVLAYAGVALPTMLYFATSSFTGWELVNQELFASEIIRMLIGSLGLILTVPVTTLLAVFLRSKHGEHDHGGHTHSHSHHH